jgi:hypothetical protein
MSFDSPDSLARIPRIATAETWNQIATPQSYLRAGVTFSMVFHIIPSAILPCASSISFTRMNAPLDTRHKLFIRPFCTHEYFTNFAAQDLGSTKVLEISKDFSFSETLWKEFLAR